MKFTAEAGGIPETKMLSGKDLLAECQFGPEAKHVSLQTGAKNKNAMSNNMSPVF